MSGKLLAARASMRSATPRCGCGKLAMYANTGSSPVAGFAGLALPVMATSSFVVVLPRTFFLRSRLPARFFDCLLDTVILSLQIWRQTDVPQCFDEWKLANVPSVPSL